MLLDTTPSEFRRRFEAGLDALLTPDGIGAFILALANSMQSSELQRALSPRLERLFAELRGRLARGDLENAGPDDLAVFAALEARGIEDFRSWHVREAGPWRLAYNPMRALRPPRASKQPFAGLSRPFDPQAFHFDKPFLRPEIINEISFDGVPLRIMYHKFPFAPWHLLLVIDAAAHRPQYLDDESHDLLWSLTDVMAAQLPDIGLAYNSLGAGASINHLHAHSFLSDEPLPLEAARWRHNGGEQPYPLQVERFESLRESRARIGELQQRDQPFNLLYRPGHCYLAPRPPQNSVPLPDWMGVPAWYEIAGGFNLAEASRFQALTAADIEAALALLNDGSHSTE